MPGSEASISSKFMTYAFLVVVQFPPKRCRMTPCFRKGTQMKAEEGSGQSPQEQNREGSGRYQENQRGSRDRGQMSSYNRGGGLGPLVDPRRQFRNLQKMADTMFDRAFNPRVGHFCFSWTMLKQNARNTIVS